MNFFKSDITDEGICEFIRDCDKVVTPDNICWDMITLVNDTTDFFKRPEKLDEKYINSHRVLDFYCQSGSLVINCVKYFIKTLYPFFDTLDDLIEFIYKNLIYAVCPTDIICGAVASRLYDEINIDDSNLFVKDENTIIPEEIKDMKFDLVVGNPPYNKDIYLDFVIKGHSLSKGYSLWITPAKWQAKVGEKNEEFRKNIVPYMSYIVYYPCAQEIFDIRNIDGISYYLVDKNNMHEEKGIKNISLRQPLFNNSESRNYNKQLNNVANRIFSKIDFSKILKISSIDVKHFGLSSGDTGKDIGELNVMQGDNLKGHYVKSSINKNVDDIEKYKVVMLHMCGNSYYGNDGQTLGLNKMYINRPNDIQVYDYMPIYICDTEDECKSFISYFDTRLIRFIIMMSLVGQTANNDEFWRMIPDPGAFNHIFTDDELYKKYNLTDEEISIIESVIKERS